MESLSAQAARVLADARLATIPGAIGASPDRDNEVIAASVPSIRGATAPSAAPLSVAIDGAGVFALEESGRRVYSRLGDFALDGAGRLTDGRGRFVLGTACAAQRAARTANDAPIAVADLAPISLGSKRFATYAIDERGVLSGVRDGTPTPIARLALAVFPAPERLERLTESALKETPSAGAPRIVEPGAPNVGSLLPHALENALVDLDGDLARLWRLRRRGEMDAAHAAAADECVRDALGLVK